MFSALKDESKATFLQFFIVLLTCSKYKPFMLICVVTNWLQAHAYP